MNDGLNFEVCPVQSEAKQKEPRLLYLCIWGSLNEIISQAGPLFSETPVALVYGLF